MPAYVGAVLAEQQAVISLLMRRLRAAEYESVADAETLVRALFGHLKVAEHLLLPAFVTSRHFASAKAALGLAVAHLAAAVAEQQRTGSLTSYAQLDQSVPMLFAAEGLLLHDATKTELHALSGLGQQAEEEFTLLIGRADLFNDVRQTPAGGEPTP